MTRGPDAWREASARTFLSRLALRPVFNGGVGIMQTWHECEQQEARDQLLAEHGRVGQDAEAHRTIDVVDGTASAAPTLDARWD